MTLIGPADTAAPRSYTLRGVALLATAGMVAAVNLLAIPGSAQAATAAASHPSVVVPAVAAGPLTPRGCTVSGTTDSCDLYAMAGTTSMNGGAPINIWGFSSTGAAGSATAPGPVLVVNQGDTVSVTLHNQIVGQNVSLTFPGQPTTAFAAGSLSAAAEETGIGSTDPAKTYTFTAARAGTFIYEAGHTANGTRQVAMGLAGALVVLPPIVPAVAPALATHNAYGVVAGYPDTTYADDSVVVLSEIDPALNAAPATFDMRNFAPNYRLINGKPFPATDVISTDQGHVVLLRYVNVGSQDHSMSLLGVDQTQVARDGHAMRYAESEVAMAVTAGATADTLVTMPTGPETKVALYEAAGRLDNNGQSTGGPQYSLAFGGMLTFLDTAFVDPNPGDRVGPVSSHVTASPNPSNGLADVTISADISDASTGGSNVDQAEIVIDDASPTTGLAPGAGIPMTGGFGSPNVVGATGTISTTVLAALPAGKHTVFVRAHDTAGNWGVVGATIFNLPKTGPQTTNGSATPSPANGTLPVAIAATGDDRAAGATITGAEYFLDTVGANTTGMSITPNRVASVVSLDPVIPAATVLALTEGVHHVFVHSLDSLGLWGPTLDIPLSVDKTGPGVDGADVKPNPTNGILTTTAHPGYLWVSASITDPNTGGSGNTVADAEFFLDTIGAPGTGAQLAPVDGSMNASTESVAGGIPISQIRSLSNGTHQVSVRGQDAAGNWGPVYTMNLIVDKVAPVLVSVTGSQNPTTGVVTLTAPLPVNETGGFAGAEFWLGTTAPIAGKGTSVPFAVVGGNLVATVPLAGLPAGALRFNLRVQDAAGNWSNGVFTTVTVRQNAIFSNGFTVTTTPFGWSSRTGTPTVQLAAGIPVGGTNRGLRVTEPGGAKYVSDNSPTAETNYHASFAFNANTLNPGTAVLTLFDASTLSGAQVLAVQLQRVGVVNQIGTVMSGSAGPTTWVNLLPGAHTIRVDWAGATAGSLQLSLDGSLVSTQTGDTSTLLMETARLGITAGAIAATTGTAYFDNFVSTRYTLP